MANERERDEWLQRVLGVTRAEAGAGAEGHEPGGGLDGWKAAHKNSIGQLKALEKHIRAMKHPRGDAAVVLLRSVQMNLTAEPRSARDVAELERYLNSDDVVAEAERPNGFGITVQLREPLLKALAALKQTMAA